MIISTTIHNLCSFYGVHVDEGEPDEEVTLYRTSDGWHIRGEWRDSQWAPTSDDQAKAIVSEGYGEFVEIEM